MDTTKELGEVTTLVTRGVSPKYVEENGYTVINQRCIRDNRLSLTDSRLTDKEKTSIKPEKYVQKWDVLVNSTGVGTLGRTAQVIEKLENTTVDTHVTIVRPDLEILYGRYLGYVMALNEPAIENLAKGATGQTELSRHLLSEIEITIPEYITQKEIATILSAFDNLIENNTRRIEILEEMARLIYREWFVHYRYTGHENDKLVDSGTDLGEIPEGWKVKKLEDTLEHYIGGGWGKEEQMKKYPDPAYVIRGTDIPGATKGDISDVPFRYHKVSNLRSRKLKDGDIVFEVSGGSKGQPLGRSLLITDTLLSEFDSEVMCASFCKLMRVNQEVTLPELLYLKILEMYDDRRIMKYQVQSTGISNFKFSFFLEDLEVLIPPIGLRNEFAKKVRPLFKEMHLLGKKNARLKSTRDLLLPKLISGKVKV